MKRDLKWYKKRWLTYSQVCKKTNITYSLTKKIIDKYIDEKYKVEFPSIHNTQRFCHPKCIKEIIKIRKEKYRKCKREFN